MIENKVVVVTGASSGIGAATAEVLAARGARLVLAGRDEQRLAGVTSRITGAGGQARGVVGDVSRPADVRALVHAARETYGRLDVLVSNAGIATVAPLDDGDVEAWDRMVDVNLKGALHAVAAALPVFREQRDGHFVFTVSTSGLRITPNQAVYAATKNAVRTLAEGLRQEAGPDLRVTAVSPGFVATPFSARSAGTQEVRDSFEQMSKVAIAPEAIANAVAFAIDQPREVDVNEMVVRPTAQG